MHIKNVFINRHDDLRVGWRLLMFLLLVAIGILAFAISIKVIGIRNDLLARLAALASTLGASYVMMRFVNKKPFGAFGLMLHPNTLREFGIGCLLGFLMMSGIFVLELMTGYATVIWRGLDFLSCLKIVGFSIISFSVAAFLEEVFFRGYLFQTLMQGITFLPATLLFAFLFSFSHYANPNMTALSFANIALAGIWLSIAYMKTRSLWLPFGLHFSWNFSQTTLYSFPTSGGSLSEHRMSDLVQTGPEWVTGGPFGPEGGILATLALVLCIWFILKSRNLHTPEGIITLDSVEDLLPKPGIAEGQSA